MPAAEGTARATSHGPVRSITHLVSCIRLDEVLVLQGTPLFGALFSAGTLTGPKCLKLLLFVAASSCLVAHVFVLNDWCGASSDLRDPNRAKGVFTAKGIGRDEIRRLCLVLLALSLLLLVPFGPAPLVLAITLAILSALYSVPGFSMKGTPLLSSVLHLSGGLFHFLLGYSLFRPVDWRGAEIGSFFALTFVAGHLTQEARDYESDLKNRIRTNAVRFGPTRCFAVAFVIFTVADVLLFVLAQRGVVPHVLVVTAGFYPVHLWWTLRTAFEGVKFDNVRRLQARYRILYALIGLIMISALLDFG